MVLYEGDGTPSSMEQTKPPMHLAAWTGDWCYAALAEWFTTTILIGLQFSVGAPRKNT